MGIFGELADIFLPEIAGGIGRGIERRIGGGGGGPAPFPVPTSQPPVFIPGRSAPVGQPFPVSFPNEFTPVDQPGDVPFLPGFVEEAFRGSGGCDSLFFTSTSSPTVRARRQITVMNPATGKIHFYENKGKPLAFSSDMRAVRRLRRLAGQARRVVSTTVTTSRRRRVTRRK